MAKCKVHGSEVGTVYFTTSAKRYMSDGVVLKNNGFGWKIFGHVKDGVTPEQAYSHAIERQNQRKLERPALFDYQKALHELAGLGKRWKLHTAIEMMPDDPDGVWSEACDSYGDNVSASIDEVSKVCDLYRIAMIEAKEKADIKQTES